MRSTFFILLALTLMYGCGHTNRRLNILFDNVDGLSIGSEVKCKGLKIGEVVSLEIINRKVLAGIVLTKKTQIPSDSKFFIQSSVLGSTSIEVELSNKSVLLTSKDTVQGTFSRRAILDDLISDSTKKKEIKKSLEKITSGVAEIVEKVARDSVQKK